MAAPVRSNHRGGACRSGPVSGGNGTLTGASANLAVAGIAERNGVRFGFIRFLAYGVPMTLVPIAICQAYVLLRYF